MRVFRGVAGLPVRNRCAVGALPADLVEHPGDVFQRVGADQRTGGDGGEEEQAGVRLVTGKLGWNLPYHSRPGRARRPRPPRRAAGGSRRW